MSEVFYNQVHAEDEWWLPENVFVFLLLVLGLELQGLVLSGQVLTTEFHLQY